MKNNKWNKVFVLKVNYGYGYEDETAETTRKDILQRAKEYRQEGYNDYKIVCRKELNRNYKV